jgi:hypothetical protein
LCYSHIDKVPSRNVLDDYSCIASEPYWLAGQDDTTTAGRSKQPRRASQYVGKLRPIHHQLCRAMRCMCMTHISVTSQPPDPRSARLEKSEVRRTFLHCIIARVLALAIAIHGTLCALRPNQGRGGSRLKLPGSSAPPGEPPPARAVAGTPLCVAVDVGRVLQHVRPGVSRCRSLRPRIGTANLTHAGRCTTLGVRQRTMRTMK